MELLEARRDLHVELETGNDTRCPCCNSFLKVYKRSVYARPAREMINLYRLGGAEKFIHIVNFKAPGAGGGDFAKANYFGLVTKAVNTNPHKKCSGYWMLTKKGVNFVEGIQTIDKYALVYQGDLLGFAGEQIGIEDCLGKEFSYHELMRGLA